VKAQAGDDAVIGIDAPIVIPNETGMRVADRLAHSMYGKYHAGAYPASRLTRFWQRTTGLSSSLVRSGFRHGDNLTTQSRGRYQIEVHPHAAAVQLFVLDRIVKYKKGTLAARAAELERLRGLMLERLPRLVPALALSALPEIPKSGLELKAVEDQIDAVLAAYIAAHWWYWGLERNDVLGNARMGYIIVPRRQTMELKFLDRPGEHDLQVEQRETALGEADVHPNPIVQFQEWFQQAQAAGVHEPNALTLATCAEDGQPSARMVLLKEAGEDGFVFYTNYKSRKGRELNANPRAAMVFFWPELHRQVRITGQVERTSRAEAEAYFGTPRGARSWAPGRPGKAR
jgi:predicted RNase H-like nuclease